MHIRKNRYDETLGGNAKDQVAADYVVGHNDSDMAATYREEIPDCRLTKVRQFVREWYLK